MFSSNFKIWAITVASCSVSLLATYDAGILSVVNPSLIEVFGLSKGTSSWISITATIFCILGALLSCYLVNKQGRKFVTFEGNILVILGSILFFLSNSFYVVIFSRVLFGLGLGLSYTASFLYLSEWCPPEKRGQLIGFSGCCATAGIFLSIVIRQVFAVKVPWRPLVALPIVPATLQMFVLLFFPDPPKWLARKGMYPEAQKAYHKVHGVSPGLQLPKWTDYPPVKCFTTDLVKAFGLRSFNKALICDLFVQASQHLAGLNLISHLLEGNGGAELNIWAEFVVTSVVPFVGVMITICIVDRKKVGRKRLLVTCLFCIAICLYVLSKLMKKGQLSESGENLFWVLIIMGVFKIFYSIGLESVPTIINFEVYPTEYLGLGAGLGMGMSWTLSLVSYTIYAKEVEDANWKFSIIGHCWLNVIFGIALCFLLDDDAQGRSLI